MSKIDLIKEDLELFNATTEENVRYLLSKLEAAEKALEYAKEKSAADINRLKESNGDLEALDEERNYYLDITEALQQLRA